MKNRIALAIVVIISAYALLGCSVKSDEKYIEEQIGINIPEPENISYVDEHGGFHGDGHIFAKVEFLAKDKETILNELKENSKWRELPLSENLNLFMYGGMRDGTSYGYNIAGELGIPKIENGYWYFFDRHSESIDASSDTKLFNRFSFNLTIAMYDADTNILYYVEFDT